MKKIILFFTILSTVFCAAQTFTIANINYEVTSHGLAEVKVIESPSVSGSVTIPDTIVYNGKNYTVTAVGDRAFYNTKLSAVSIAGTVTSIGVSAFSITAIKEIEIPDSIKEISKLAFKFTFLEKIKLPASITILSSGLFDTTPSLKEITIPSEVTQIGDLAFRRSAINVITLKSVIPPSLNANVFSGVVTDLSSATLIVPNGTKSLYASALVWKDFGTIKEELISQNNINYEVTSHDLAEVKVIESPSVSGSVTIPDTIVYNDKDYTVTAIGDRAFYNTKLSAVSIPNTVTSIGVSAFSITAIKEIEIPDSVKEISKLAFKFTFLEKIKLPASITTLSSGLFDTTPSLKEITIPSEVTQIGDLAFRRSAINVITLKSVIPPSLNANVFSGVVTDLSRATLIVPNGTKSLYASAFVWKDFGTIKEELISQNNINYEVTSHDLAEVKVIESPSVSGSVTIPDTIVYNDKDYTVTAIGDRAFYNTKLSAVSIPNTVTSIGVSAFSITAIKEIEIPDSVKEISKLAFKFTFLERIKLPASITILSSGLFDTTPSLKEITIPSEVTQIGDLAFRRSAINVITLKSVIPPSLNTNVFSGVVTDLSRATLIVPNGTKSLYTSVLVWKDFGTIKEIGTLRTPSFSEKRAFEIFVKDNVLEIQALDEAYDFKAFKVFDFNGIQVAESKEQELNISTFLKGIYVIQVHTSRGVLSKKISL
ncbi:leucine-rich repeat domain-containing protein [Tenacibaculum jejuense]|uniref:Secretion system C-terminal sorting domain-containing protein n=1 Tax=Tenacibaculum jejuense TaxID=584609 RepID=A0A238U4Z3_9FLAO|nr:leucine-rich repeat domain-containing protein [Tenacibaculum jejuense]SNR14207.1 exported protein of unknown function [Tenacibaculum jejuense]